MRELPEPVRRERDRQRKEFVRAVGAGYEELVKRGIEPEPWMAAVVRMLEEMKTSDAGVESAAGSPASDRASGLPRRSP